MFSKVNFVMQVTIVAVAKASPNRAIKLDKLDPKLSDLPMARAKRP